MSTYTQEDREILLRLAKDSIAYGLKYKKVMPIELEKYSLALKEELACFVTLKLNNNLRGCIGSLEAYQPLVLNVVHNAYAAAFSDPRFRPLVGSEFAALDIHISILSKPEPIHFVSEEDLLRQIRPGIDGLILSDGWNRGTFLPSVWEELPEPEMFLRHLKTKAGLPSDYWSNNIQLQRYTAEYI